MMDDLAVVRANNQYHKIFSLNNSTFIIMFHFSWVSN